MRLRRRARAPLGDVVKAVTDDLTALYNPHPAADALRALALRLAAAVETCPERRLAQLAAELRFTVSLATAFTPMPDDQDDEGDDVFAER